MDGVISLLLEAEVISSQLQVWGQQATVDRAVPASFLLGRTLISVSVETVAMQVFSLYHILPLTLMSQW